MVSEDELNRAVLKATIAESLAEEKMIAAEKAVVKATTIVNKITEKYEKAVQNQGHAATEPITIYKRVKKVTEKIGREKERAETAKVAAEIEAKRVIAEDIKKANAARRAADRALKDYKENRS